ncbi:MAG TPA: hypothetical protein VGI14_00730 [Casimicrobiaceae bacterium]|jgi:hypothetical protein
MSELLDAAAALRFVREQGVVLASAKGEVPRVIEAILGEPITGNWWGHPRGSSIYNVLAQVCASDEVLVCRLIGGKITLVHRRLWPALVRVAGRFEARQLARVREEHGPNGRHTTRELAFPRWVPPEVHEQSAQLAEQEALEALGPAVGKAQSGSKRRPTR